MKPITMYEAVDGSRHDTEEKARRRDILVDDVNVALAGLVPKPDDPTCSFANGHGYVQQSPASVRECKRQLMAIAKHTIGGYEHVWDADPDDVHPMGVAGRIIDDSGHRPLYVAWSRLMCIDADAREWGQPYYALNPGKGEQFAVTSTQPPRDGRGGREDKR
jgi:hypothetical protein